jgi:NitT/TauT family transport system ATP-binding protein
VTTAPVIVASGISKSFFGKGGRTEALRSVDFTAAERSFVTVLGPSGCGKSTLLQILGGLLGATSGTVQLHGAPVDGPPRSAIYVFQQYTKSLFPWRTVNQNVAFGLENRSSGLSNADISLRVREYVNEHLGLRGFENHYPWQLSGGMQQRVALARALVCQPQVLLMDEPLGSLDALTRADLQDLILRLWTEQALTIVFVTHDIDEAIYLSDRVIVLTSAPGEIARDIAIDLPRPRDQIGTRELPRYAEYRRELFTAVHSRAQHHGG